MIDRVESSAKGLAGTSLVQPRSLIQIQCRGPDLGRDPVVLKP